MPAVSGKANRGPIHGQMCSFLYTPVSAQHAIASLVESSISRQSIGSSVRFSPSPASNGTLRIFLRISALVAAAMSLVTQSGNQCDDPSARLVLGNASHGERRVIETTEPVLRDHQDRQLHFDRPNRLRSSQTESARASRRLLPR